MLKSMINPDLSGKHTKLVLTFLLFIFLSTNLFAQVTQEWVARYNGPANQNDTPPSVAVDDYGNVYVTGLSDGMGTGRDYATIKYNSSGVQQWIQRYNGPGNSDDQGTSIAVDNSGNVYVTGGSNGIGTGFDYATIKYNSSGVQQWVQRYVGPGNSYDCVFAMALDDSSNVYVTGECNLDIVTIKYNSAGIFQWINTYNGPTNLGDRGWRMTLDDNGNVYVVGDTGFNPLGDHSNCVTIKYNSAGVQQWVVIYDGPYNDDGGNMVAADSSGNIYVIAWSEGPSSRICITLKYSSSGVQQWLQTYSGSGEDMGLDNSGNVYVTGWYWQNYRDYATVKYSPTGIQLWNKSYNGPGNGDDVAIDLVVDDMGNVYVAGRSMGSGTGFDFTTIKYNSSGVQQWIQRYNGPGNGNDGLNSIAIDGSGNVYVTGPSIGIGTGFDYATVKYSQTPIPVPAAPLLASPPNNAVGQGLNLLLVWNPVAYASTYRVQLASDTSFTNIILDDSTLINTVKAVTNLSPLTYYYWRVNAKNISGTGPFSSIWNFKTLGSPTQVNLLYPPDDTTNIPVNVNFIWSKPGEQTYAIRILNPGNKDNRVISKYWFELTNDTSGVPLIKDSTLTDTTKLVSGLNGLTLYYWRVKAKNEIGWGVYSVWFNFTTAFLPPTPVLVSPQNGALLVETNPLLDWDSSATALSYRVQVSTDSLFTSTVYDSSGIPITEFQIPNNGLNINTTYYWRVNATNVTGTGPWSAIFHFMTGTTNITLNNEIPKEFRLYNSYPNPFNPSTKIKFDIPKSSFVKLIVYDVLGREIKTLVNEKLNAGRYEVEWNGSDYPSGVYFYKMVTGEYVSVKKMLLIK